jgi:hypothetical protein
VLQVLDATAWWLLEPAAGDAGSERAKMVADRRSRRTVGGADAFAPRTVL